MLLTALVLNDLKSDGWDIVYFYYSKVKELN